MKLTKIQQLAREAVAEEVGDINAFIKTEVKRMIRASGGIKGAPAKKKAALSTKAVRRTVPLLPSLEED